MAQPVLAPPRQLRFRLKPAGSVLGSVDGAWWPRSRRLPDELPEIVQTISFRLPELERVCYRFQEWDDAPRRARIGDKWVRLDGYAHQRPETIRFVGSGTTLVFALIAPDADPEAAHDAMMLAAGRGNTQSPHDFYLTAEANISDHRDTQTAEDDWESEGGQPPRRYADVHTRRPPSWA